MSGPSSNFSVERMAAGGACLQIRVSVVRRHRSPSALARLARMNVFATDHPLMTEPSPRARRIQRGLWIAVGCHAWYLLALFGPVCGLADRE